MYATCDSRRLHGRARPADPPDPARFTRRKPPGPAAFAFAIYRDANSLQRVFGLPRVGFVSPFIWAAATLLGSVFVAVAYWVIHHSRLAHRPG
jgi:hypothetical protein